MKMNRREQRKAATRELLLRTAQRIIAERGYGAVDVFDITECANLSKGTFYLHFASKEECIRQVMLQGLDALQQIIAEEQTAQSSTERVLNSYYNFFEWAINNQQILSIMLDETAPYRLNLFGRTYIAKVVERQIQEMGIYPEENGYSPFLVAQVITGILIQLLNGWIKDYASYSTRDMAQIANNIVISGFGLPDV